jgi:hypothetical protein
MIPVTPEKAVEEMCLLANKGWSFVFKRPDLTIGRPDFDFIFQVSKRSVQVSPTTEEEFIVSGKNYYEAQRLAINKAISITEDRNEIEILQSRIAQTRNEKLREKFLK